MKVLIADDDAVCRRMLEVNLRQWGYDVVMARDGAEAWRALEGEDSPRLAILDWMMPVTNGVDLCLKVREARRVTPAYVILLTTRGEKESVVRGLDAGADDYVTKPFNRDELHARLRVGVRVLELQTRLADRVSELEQALASVRLLQGLLPICAYCKKIRNDRNYWQQVEGYISEHSEAQFSHGICPECFERVVKPELKKSLAGGDSQQ